MSVISSLSSIDFSPEIERLTQDFTGRDWVFKEVDDWLVNSQERFLIIVGEPGIGKSAIVSRLTQIKDNIAAHHFCIAGQGGTLDPENILLSISKQLIYYESLPEYAENLVNIISPLHLSININIQVKESGKNSHILGVVIKQLRTKSSQEACEIILRRTLGAIQNPPTKPIVILIDSLDEAVSHSSYDNIVKLLSQAQDLPTWVRILCTTRPDRRVLRELDALQPRLLTINSNSNQNLADLREYVQQRINDEKIKAQLRNLNIDSIFLAETISELADGNFLFTKLLLDDIEEGNQNLNNISSLPKNIEEFYHQFLVRRCTEDEWKNKHSKILGILTISRKPLSQKQISILTGLKIRVVQQEVRVLRQFFKITQLEDNKTEGYSLFHQSFRDYLLNEEVNEDFWCDPDEENEKIANYYIRNALQSWKSEVSLYGFQYAVTHSILAKLDRGIIQLLTDTSFLSGKLYRLGANELIEDFYHGYNLISSQDNEEFKIGAGQIVESLLNYILTMNPSEYHKFSIDRIHSALFSSPDLSFYRHFLEISTNPEYIYDFTDEFSRASDILLTSKVRLANVERRQGNLSEAISLLTDVLNNRQAFDIKDSESSKELARIEYDLGYIQYLKGLFSEATEHLNQSSLYAERAGDIVGQWISLCIEFLIKFEAGLCSAKKYEEVLQQGLIHFQVEAEKDIDNPHASRWIMNAYCHLLDLACEEEDIEAAEKYFADIQRQDEIEKSKKKTFYISQYFLKPFFGRFALLKQDGNQAKTEFQEYFWEARNLYGDEELKKQAFLAKHYYNYGRAYIEDGEYENGRRIWFEALELPDEPGNHIWKAKIRSALENL